MKVDMYIEILYNEGFGIEQDIAVLHTGKAVSTIQVTDKIAINLFKDRLQNVNGATIYANVGIDDELHYMDTIRVIEIVSRLLLNISRADRQRVYETLKIGEDKSTQVIIDHYLITYKLNEDLLVYEIV